MNEDKELQKRTYELAFVLATEDEEAAILRIFGAHHLEPITKSPITQIRLAYPIEKHETGYFGYYHFTAEPDVIQKLRQTLSLEAGILRLLIVTPPPKMSFPPPRTQVREPQVKPAPREEVLSNEALEEKLEEILK